jgi:hypothetical protein
MDELFVTAVVDSWKQIVKRLSRELSLYLRYQRTQSTMIS